jgi:hypothetical protein
LSWRFLPVRDIFRKLLRELHPDRERNTPERERKTALMQRLPGPRQPASSCASDQSRFSQTSLRLMNQRVIGPS